MNSFWTLTGFEYKKIFCKKSVLLFLIIAWLLTIYSCFTMVMGNNNQGNYYTKGMSSYESMLLDKKYEKELAGRSLDGNLILEASKAYQKIEKNVTRYRDSESYQIYARPYYSIYSLIDAAYVKPGAAFNVDDFQNLSEEDANNYYTMRENQYRANLTHNPLFSAEDVDTIMELDQNVKKPFIMEYIDGYQRFFALSTTIILILLFIISFCISPIFSDEYAKRTDSLILTSKNGKKTVLYAKVFTSVTFSFGAGLVLLLSTYFACMGIYGFDGTYAQIQLIIPALTYNFTMLDATILVICTSLLGAFLHTALCMLLSVFSKNSMIPMAITSILILVGLLNGVSNPLLTRLRLFLPSAMGSFWEITTQLVFDVFGTKLMLYQMTCVVSFILGAIFLVLACRGFRRHQIS